MSLFYQVFKGIVDMIPVVIRKIGSILLVFFTLGALFGYYIAFNQGSPLFFLLLGASVVIMWKNLDEGILALSLVLIIGLLFPNIL